MNHIKYKDIDLEFDDNVEIVIEGDKIVVRSKNQFYFYPYPQYPQYPKYPQYPTITWTSSNTDFNTP